MDKHTNENYQKTNLSPIAAGITGFVLGVVGTAAVALSDKNTRSKVNKKAQEMKNNLEKWSKYTVQDIKISGEDIKKQTTEKMDDAKAYAAKTKEDMASQTEELLHEEK